MSDKAIVIHNDPDNTIMPVVAIEAMSERYTAIVRVKDAIMRDGVDYGTIPGTDKPTLLKPGAEKLCTFFGLWPEFTPLDEVVAWDAAEPFFFFRYKCTLKTRDGRFTAGSGIGSCNSREKKYRYRLQNMSCPKCSGELRKSKTASEYYCWAKTGGCGATFRLDDPQVANQERGYIPNPDIADCVNTIDKMAQKRALVAATLVAVGASDFFTQDLEDVELQGLRQEIAPAEYVGAKEPRPLSALADVQMREMSNTERGGVAAYVEKQCRDIKHHNHFVNRWKKRFSVDDLADITATASEFADIMRAPAEEWDDCRLGLDEGNDVEGVAGKDFYD